MLIVCVERVCVPLSIHDGLLHFWKNLLVFKFGKSIMFHIYTLGFVLT